MGRLVEAAEAHLVGCRVIRGAAVESIAASPAGYALRLKDGSALQAKGVILAIPAFDASRLVRCFDADLAAALRQFPSVSTATVAMAYRSSALRRPLRGYGYLRPRAEGGPIVGCTWVSAKWPGRAPTGFSLLRAFVGRAGDDHVVSLPDSDLLQLVREELGQVLGITDQPHLSRIHRWRHGMPQYTVGHAGRLATIEDRLTGYPGLLLAGHSYHGVGIPDCIRSGERAAARWLEQRSEVGA